MASVESWLWWYPGCETLDVESWVLNPGCGILAVEFLGVDGFSMFWGGGLPAGGGGLPAGSKNHRLFLGFLSLMLKNHCFFSR